MAFLELAKKHLRVTVAAFDDEIQGLIDAATADLALSGVLPEKASDDTDPLIKRAVFLYVKSEFGFDNADAERFRKSYDSLKSHLTLSVEYTVPS
ncbi:head-tail connector protein [Paenibacillus methanolicus]|uniref:Putative phage protein (Predicted DNA packaging) n=1 Tax=Paenibacillus methanolicus TaxID=582686 RepID=A0A5S5BNG3_9BACL|nr:head-tail connector protein [Paenibacillus methanolicus]TYP67692.1 putative phage protein (predicted DNA packaging) [Paenibacillus methanolicus]